jgi:hypothetical protein
MLSFQVFLPNYVPRAIESVSWKMEQALDLSHFSSNQFVCNDCQVNIRIVFDVRENIANILLLQIHFKLNVVRCLTD